MDLLEKYRLELEEYANNSSIKREGFEHIIKEDLDKIYMGCNFSHMKDCEVFDLQGEEDLKKYEKWLIDGQF